MQKGGLSRYQQSFFGIQKVRCIVRFFRHGGSIVVDRLK